MQGEQRIGNRQVVRLTPPLRGPNEPGHRAWRVEWKSKGERADPRGEASALWLMIFDRLPDATVRHLLALAAETVSMDTAQGDLFRNLLPSTPGRHTWGDIDDADQRKIAPAPGPHSKDKAQLCLPL